MAQALSRVRAVINGLPGGPGVCTFFADGGAVPDLTALRAAFAALGPVFPSALSVQIENQGDVIQSADGSIVGTWNAPAVTAVAGGAGGAYVGPVGGHIGWQTADLHNGKHLRGRTFIVPLSVAAFDSNGRLIAGATTALTAFGAAFLGGSGTKWAVWGRPRKASATLSAAPGTSGLITAARVTNQATVLRSRRD